MEPSRSGEESLAGKTPGVSIVIPVYNSELTLPLLIQRLEPVLKACADEYEVVLVNDGSRDTSWAKISELIQSHPWIIGINLMRNFGQHNAILCGIRAANFPVIVTIDDDLQHPPEEMPKLIAKLAEGYDVVYGKPEHRQQGMIRDLATLVVKLTMKTTMGISSAGDVSPFRAFRTQLRDAFKGYQSPYVIIDVLLAWGAARYSVISVRHDPRTLGVSNYNLYKLIKYSLDVATSFSAFPLRFASIVGLVTGLLGILLLAFVVIVTLIDPNSPPGFPFLASMVAIFSGAQLLALGIIGEYVAKLHFRSMERPPYVVGEVTTSRIGEVTASRPL